jgi:tetratricopeptide (TPR) repeat protein
MTRTARSQRNRLLAAGLALSAMSLCATAYAVEPIAWERIEDPHIRAAQFDLFMGAPFAGLTQLLADQQQGRVKQRPAQMELALGGMYLAYGAHYKAAQIFKKLGESDQPQRVRNLAWHQLARVQYQRGLDEEALQALQQIRGDLPIEAQQERLLLSAMLLMRQQRYDEAVAQLRLLGQKSLVQQLSEKSVWATYGRFNLGVALFRQGKEEEGRKLLEELGQVAVKDEESRSLRDKANLTLAYHFLGKQDPDTAQSYFVKTRLQGPMSSKALLGLGRAYSTQKQHKKSLVPWMKLTQRDTSDPAVQDALLAVPFAFGQLDAYKQALEYYQAALQAYKQEMESLQQAESAVASGVLMDNLARTMGSQGIDDKWFVSKLPDTPGGRYLWPLFATHEFQESLKNYSQLRLALGKLEQWSSEIDEGKDLSPSRQRELDTRIAFLQAETVGMLDQLRDYMKSLAMAELERRRQRLVSYAGEARFSMAQIYDYASKRWGGEQ